MVSRSTTLQLVCGALLLTSGAQHLLSQTPRAAAQQLFWVDRSGKVGQAIGQPQAFSTGPVLTADVSRVLVRSRDKDGEKDDIWIQGVTTSTKTRVTSDPADDRHPDWSPKADRVVFYSYRNGLADLFIKAGNGTGPDEPLTADKTTHEYGPSWSPDGSVIMFHAHEPKSDRRELQYITMSDRKIKTFLPGAPGIGMPRFSPDGKHVAYVSNESGKWEVYVRAFPDGKESVKVSTGSGMWPKWSAKSNELFYFDGTAVMAVTVQYMPFKASAPRKLFTAAEVGLTGSMSDAFNPLFDVTADGQRFVIVRTASQS